MIGQKRLLMLNASWHELPFILAARKMGFYVITTSTKAEYPGHRYADEYVPFDYSDYDGLVDLCKRIKIDAISWGTTDPCALAACYVGEKLGLKGHDTYENGQIIHLKDRFKAFAKKYGINTPIAEHFENEEDALAFESKATYPVIVKPVDLAGGQGIKIIRDKACFAEAVKNAFHLSREKRIIVEPFVEGTLHSLNTFIVDQKVVSYCTANDYSYLNKYMTNSGVSPADHWQEAIKYLIPETEKVAQILGLVDGQLHMQYIMQPNGKPVIIEMMRRNIGNFWSSMLNDAAGVNWPDWVIRAEAGMDCHSIPGPKEPKGFYGYHMMLADRNGIFKDVTISPEFQKYVYQVVMWEEPGFEITNYLSNKVGNCLFHFNTEEEKNYYMPLINDMVKVNVE